MAQIRYPGSKHKIRDQIISHFPDYIRYGLWSASSNWQYVEPFFGSGAIGWEILEVMSPGKTVVLSDVDYWLVCLWKAVAEQPYELCQKIAAFIPSAEAFYLFQAEDGKNDIEPVECGFRKLALHQMSFSGLGAMSGGPLGGKDQTNAKYNVECRWNPEMQMEMVWKRHRLLKGHHVKISTADFSGIVSSCNGNSFIYCDPPYVEKGQELYKYSFSDLDHKRLRDVLYASPAKWVVSYDSHPMVESLYAGRRFHSFDVFYSTSEHVGKRRKNKEVLIFSD